MSSSTTGRTTLDNEPLESRVRSLEERIQTAKSPSEKIAIADEYKMHHHEVLLLSANSDIINKFFRNSKLFHAWIATFAPLTYPDLKIDSPITAENQKELDNTNAAILSLKPVEFLQHTNQIESKTTEDDVIKKINSHFPVLKHQFAQNPVYAEFCFKNPKLVAMATAVLSKNNADISFKVPSSHNQHFLPTHFLMGKFFLVCSYRLQFLKNIKSPDEECRKWLDIACEYGYVTALMDRINNTLKLENPFESQIQIYLKQIADMYGQFGYFQAAAGYVSLGKIAIKMGDAELGRQMMELAALYFLTALKLENESFSKLVMQVMTKNGSKSIFSDKGLQVYTASSAVNLIQKDLLQNNADLLVHNAKEAEKIVEERKKLFGLAEEKRVISGLIKSSRDK